MRSLVDGTGVIDSRNAPTKKLSRLNISLRKLWLKSVAGVETASGNVSSNLLAGESKWESAAEIGVKPFLPVQLCGSHEVCNLSLPAGRTQVRWYIRDIVST